MKCGDKLEAEADIKFFELILGRLAADDEYKRSGFEAGLLPGTCSLMLALGILGDGLDFKVCACGCSDSASGAKFALAANGTLLVGWYKERSSQLLRVTSTKGLSMPLWA